MTATGARTMIARRRILPRPAPRPVPVVEAMPTSCPPGPPWTIEAERARMKGELRGHAGRLFAGMTDPRRAHGVDSVSTARRWRELAELLGTEVPAWLGRWHTLSEVEKVAAREEARRWATGAT